MVGPTHTSKQSRLTIEVFIAVLQGGNMTVYVGLGFFCIA